MTIQMALTIAALCLAGGLILLTAGVGEPNTTRIIACLAAIAGLVFGIIALIKVA